MQEPPRRRALWPWPVIPLVLVAAGAIGALLAVRANSRDTSAQAAPIVTVAPAPRPMHPARTASSVSAEPAETSTTVPDVRGEKLPDAQEAIHDAGLVPERRKVPSSLGKDTVIAQSPSPGSGAEEGDQVVLTVSQGSKHGHEREHGHGHGPKKRNR